MAMTLDQMRELAVLAAQISTAAPERRNKWSVSATVPWPLVEQIRATMTAAGIDWRELTRKYHDKTPKVEHA